MRMHLENILGLHFESQGLKKCHLIEVAPCMMMFMVVFIIIIIILDSSNTYFTLTASI